MAKYRVLIDGELQDELFDTEEEAEEHALYLCGCALVGAEVLHMSDPWEGDYDPDECDSEYEIIEEDD